MSDKSCYLLNSKCKNVLLLAAVLILLFPGCSKEKKVYRIGILSGLDFFENTIDGFKAKLSDMGYVEGKNIYYEIYKTNFNAKEEYKILKKFIDYKVDLIFTFPTEVSLAAKNATRGTNIPVLFANSNIEGVNLINKIREPGGNITGVRYPGPDLALKRLEIMHQLIPKAKRFLIPYQKEVLIIEKQLEVLYPMAKNMGISIIEAPASNVEDLIVILNSHSRSSRADIDAILFIAEPLAVNTKAFQIMGKFAFEHKIPIGGALMSVSKYNTLFGVSTDNVSVGKKAAMLADKIFKGIPAGTIPVVSAENYIQINYKEIQNQGLQISDGLLRQANEIMK
jgi:putative tryptophan/tyrosine transport system substrate-binding protein